MREPGWPGSLRCGRAGVGKELLFRGRVSSVSADLSIPTQRLCNTGPGIAQGSARPRLRLTPPPFRPSFPGLQGEGSRTGAAPAPGVLRGEGGRQVGDEAPALLLSIAPRTRAFAAGGRLCVISL